MRNTVYIKLRWIFFILGKQIVTINIGSMEGERENYLLFQLLPSWIKGSVCPKTDFNPESIELEAWGDGGHLASKGTEVSPLGACPEAAAVLYQNKQVANYKVAVSALLLVCRGAIYSLPGYRRNHILEAQAWECTKKHSCYCPANLFGISDCFWTERLS